MPEGLSAVNVGEQIAARHGHAAPAGGEPSRRDRTISIVEAVMLSAVAIIAAWSGYCAAKWSTEASVALAQASATRTKASRADLTALQVRTLDSVSFNAAFAALTAHDAPALRVAVGRLRPGYRPAFQAWLATRPLTNRDAPPGPAFMPQYRIPQEARAHALDHEAEEHFDAGRTAGATADKYVRLTVLLATVLFLIGISTHFPLRAARYGLVGTASLLLVVSMIELLSLPGPPG